MSLEYVNKINKYIMNRIKEYNEFHVFSMIDPESDETEDIKIYIRDFRNRKSEDLVKELNKYIEKDEKYKICFVSTYVDDELLNRMYNSDIGIKIQLVCQENNYKEYRLHIFCNIPVSKRYKFSYCIGFRYKIGGSIDIVSDNKTRKSWRLDTNKKKIEEVYGNNKIIISFFELNIDKKIEFLDNLVMVLLKE